MESILRKHLAEKLQLGELKIHKELAVVPLFITEIGGPGYPAIQARAESTRYCQGQ